jgi:nucleoside-diphosphate-sugar epimerase
MKQVVALTGAGGFLGSVISESLQREGRYRVVTLARVVADATFSRSEQIAVDLTNEPMVAQVLGHLRPYAIVHAAGRVTGTALDLFRDNVVTTVAVANAVSHVVPDCRIVALGSAAEYGRPRRQVRIDEDAPCNPGSVYGHAKLAAYRYLVSSATQRGLHYDLLRVFNVVGIRNPTSQVVGSFISQAVKVVGANPPGKVHMGQLDAIRDFVTADDVAHAVLSVLARPSAGGVTNVCSGLGRRIRDVIRLICEQSGEYFGIEEGEPLPKSDEVDRVVGDPSRFLALIAPRQPGSVESTLRDAWRLALINHES